MSQYNKRTNYKYQLKRALHVILIQSKTQTGHGRVFVHPNSKKRHKVQIEYIDSVMYSLLKAIMATSAIFMHIRLKLAYSIQICNKNHDYVMS